MFIEGELNLKFAGKLTMQMLVRFLLISCITASLVALGLSVWPGVLSDVLFFAILFSVFWIPLFLIAGFVVVFMMLRCHKSGKLTKQLMLEAALTPCVAIASFAMLLFYVPRRAGFFASREAFESQIEGLPVSRAGIPLGKKLGVYYVDQYAKDSRGGIYFRVHAGVAGIGPDTMSYGFVKSPNPEGTPFGAASYSTSHITDDWYCFCASDDWF